MYSSLSLSLTLSLPELSPAHLVCRTTAERTLTQPIYALLAHLLSCLSWDLALCYIGHGAQQWTVNTPPTSLQTGRSWHCDCDVWHQILRLRTAAATIAWFSPFPIFTSVLIKCTENVCQLGYVSTMFVMDLCIFNQYRIYMKTHNSLTVREGKLMNEKEMFWGSLFIGESN